MFTLSNAISGTGSLSKLGPGTLLLGRFERLQGGTTISAGTLQVSGSGTWAAGPVTDNGGWFSIAPATRPFPA